MRIQNAEYVNVDWSRDISSSADREEVKGHHAEGRYCVFREFAGELVLCGEGFHSLGIASYL